jgi:hypothetical protein
MILVLKNTYKRVLSAGNNAPTFAAILKDKNSNIQKHGFALSLFIDGN